MIPVAAAAEPATFEAVVRKKGVAWLKRKGLEGVQQAPPGTKVEPYWTACLPDLMAAYGSVCAYASLRIHAITGATSVEHFAPKSRDLPQAYEWTNYRLACSKMNARKNNFTDVMDPFDVPAGAFQLSVVDGSIYPNPALDAVTTDLVVKTVARLNLDDGEMRKARLSIIEEYLAGDFTTPFLKRESPFIWGELGRQGMLRP